MLYSLYFTVCLYNAPCTPTSRGRWGTETSSLLLLVLLYHHYYYYYYYYYIIIIIIIIIIISSLLLLLLLLLSSLLIMPPKGGRRLYLPPVRNLRAVSLIRLFYISSLVLLPSPVALSLLSCPLSAFGPFS